MFSILLADDEVAALNGLLQGINWERLRISCIRTAQNARQAKQILEQQPIDLLLSDIEMPGKDGLQLIAWARQHVPDLICIFYTCHDESAYAREALRLGVFDYLLKPFPYESLEAVLGSAIEKKLANNRISEYTKYGRYWLDNRHVVAEDFFRLLLQEQLTGSRSDLQHQLERRNLGVAPGAIFLPVLLRLQERTDAAASAGWQKPELHYAVRNMAAEIFDFEQMDSHIVTPAEDELVILLVGPPGSSILEASLENACDYLLYNIIHFLELDVYCCLGGLCTITEVADEYKALQASIQGNLQRINKTTRPERSGLDEESPSPQFDVRYWRQLLNTGDIDQLQQELENSILSQTNGQPLSQAYLLAFFHAFMQVLYDALEAQSISPVSLFQGPDMQKLYSSATTSMAAMRRFIQLALQASYQAIQSAVPSDDAVSRIKEYIEENLSSDLSREQLAALVYLNPSYLSRLFKKETGQGLGDYITERRMEKACQLLARTKLPVGTIALHLGYVNMPYFSRVFKKFTGMTPGDYRSSKAESHQRP